MEEAHSPERIHLEHPPGAGDEMLQDESDFYSENGSPEKKDQQANQLQANIDINMHTVEPISFVKLTSAEPTEQVTALDFSPIPGLGLPESADPPQTEPDEKPPSPNDSSSEDLYGEDAVGDISAAELPQPSHSVDEDLGFTPEYTGEQDHIDTPAEKSVSLELAKGEQTVDEELGFTPDNTGEQDPVEITAEQSVSLELSKGEQTVDEELAFTFEYTGEQDAVDTTVGQSAALEVLKGEQIVDEDLGLTPDQAGGQSIGELIIADEPPTVEVDDATPAEGNVAEAHVNGIEPSGDSAVVGDAKEGAEMPTIAQKDPEFTAAAEANKSDANAEWRFDSSDAESSSSESSSDSSSEESDEDDSEDEGVLLDPEEQARILMQESGDADEPAGAEGPLRTINEQVEQFVQKPDITVTPDMNIVELGSVDQVVANLAVIEANTTGEYRVLQAGSALCLEDRTVIGAVAETLGRVQEPRYTVGFPSAQEMEESGLSKGTKVYYVEAHSTFVFTQPLRLAKGTDASNVHDEEIVHEEMEFSDDEKEAEYKRAVKQAKKEAKEAKEVRDTEDFNDIKDVKDIKEPNGGFLKQPPTGPKNKNRGPPARTPPSAPTQSSRKSHPDSDVNGGYPGAISYDDDEDEDMYRPLKRPDNLHEMMVAGPPISHGPPRGREDFRGGFGGRGGRHFRGGRGGMNDRGRGGFGNRGGRDSQPKQWKDQRNEREFSAPRQPSGQHDQKADSGRPPRQPKNHNQHQQQMQQQMQQHKPGKRKHGHEPSPVPPKQAKSRHPQDQKQQQQQQVPKSLQPQQPPQQHPQYQPQQQQQPQYGYPPPQPSNPPPYNPYPTQSHPQPPPQPPTQQPVPSVPAGSHVNPAFFMLQQLAQAQAQAQAHAQAQAQTQAQAQAHAQAQAIQQAPAPIPTPQPSYQQPALGGVNLQQLQQLAALLQGGQQQPAAPSPAPAPPPAAPVMPQLQQQHMSAWQAYAQQQPQYHTPPPAPAPRNDEAEARAAQERLNAIMNSYRATDPRR